MHHSGELEALRGAVVRNTTSIDGERELIGAFRSQLDDIFIDTECIGEDILA